MKTYLIRRTYQYTAEEWVEAESEDAAKEVEATSMEQCNNDEILHDSEVLEIEDDSDEGRENRK